MRVLVTGATGQLGQALVGSVPPGISVNAVGREQLDLADSAACAQLVKQTQPDWVINAGAFTAVDQAESEPALAHAVNAGAPQAFAEALAATGGRLLQVSTDFVFNGAQGSPYRPDQPVDPIGVYGATKAAGERCVLERLGPCKRGVVMRTSWVYGPVGRNFLLTMLRLHGERSEGGQPLSVVADQVGCPTSTAGLAAACWRVVERGGAGQPILHWSDAGAASWYDFAVAIGELGVEFGLLNRAAVVRPITTADYPTPSRRPSYSLLDCSESRARLGLEVQHWRQALSAVLHLLRSQQKPQLLS